MKSSGARRNSAKLLHEFPPLKRRNIVRREFEPFAVFSLRVEPLVPVRLNTCRVIRHDAMNWLNFFRQFNCNLAFSSESVSCTTDFVFTTGAMFDEIDVT